MRKNLWLIGLAIAVGSTALALLLHAGPIVTVIFGGAAAGIALFLLGVLIRERQFDLEVKKAMQAFARKSKYQYHGRRTAEEMPASEIFLFHRGDKRRWNNVVEASVNGRRGFFATFEYFESGRRGGAWLDCEVAFFPGAMDGTPEFLLDPEGVLDRLMEWFRGHDLDLHESDADRQFSSNYRLRGPDHDAILKIIDAERRAFFAEHPGWCVKSVKGDLAVWREGNLADCYRDRCTSSDQTMEDWLAGELAELTEVASKLLPPKADKA